MGLNRVVTAAALLLPCCGFAQSTKESVLKHWQTAQQFTISVAEAMPSDAYNFKPVDSEMSFGQLMNHIATSNGFYCAIASGGKSPFTPDKKDQVSKDDALGTLRKAFSFCTDAIEKMQPGDLEKVTGPEGRQMSAGDRLWAAFTHTAHHRGQAEVYLRLKGIKPPDYKF